LVVGSSPTTPASKHAGISRTERFLFSFVWGRILDLDSGCQPSCLIKKWWTCMALVRKIKVGWNQLDTTVKVLSERLLHHSEISTYYVVRVIVRKKVVKTSEVTITSQ